MLLPISILSSLESVESSLSMVLWGVCGLFGVGDWVETSYEYIRRTSNRESIF